ncbi:hypothetical protein DMA11_10400 [Marinilabiliaceae bacterium JC017]|nr:hypothetical protein DMA11_10400 [Marinilabiliaceae bacterium JC017]
MNEVVKIEYKGRDIVYELVFSSDSVDSSTFQAEGKGEIYKVESTNIDTILLDSTSPIGQQLINKSFYNISITRTQSGAATVKVYCRQLEVRKMNNALPKKFGEGRYLYCISDTGNCVYKLDAALLVEANYLGNGTWQTDPLINTIALPVINDDYNSTWQFCFMERGGDIICQAGSNGDRSYGQICRIKADDTVWNLDNKMQDSYSNGVPPNSYNPVGVSYDYETNIAYVRSSAYFKGCAIDLNANTAVLHQPLNSVLQDLTARNLAYIAASKRFFSTREIDYANNRNYSNLPPAQYPGWVLPSIPDRKYAYYSGATICNRYKIDDNSSLGSLYNRYSPYGQGIKDCVGSSVHNIIVAIDPTYQTYSIVKANIDPSLETIKYWIGDSNNFPGTNAVSKLSRVTVSDYSKVFIIRADDVSLYDQQRLVIINPDNDVQPDFGYYSMPNRISHFCTNQL